MTSGGQVRAPARKIKVDRSRGSGHGNLLSDQLRLPLYLFHRYDPVGTLPVDPSAAVSNAIPISRPFRQECLEENWLTSLKDAKMKIEARRKGYNDRKWSAPPAPTKEAYALYTGKEEPA